MRALFPPGGTNWGQQRPRSAWREFAFVWNQVRRAIEPAVSLSATLADWPAISEELSENPRKRRPQLTSYFGNDPIS